jgi:hypothetical protein
MPVPAPFRLLIAAPRPSGGVSCPSRAWSEAAYDLVESRNPAPEIQWLWPATLPHLLVALSAAPLEAAPAVLLLDAALAAGETVYLHCWGGTGRTGTAVGCHLVRHGMSGDQALQQIKDWLYDTPKRGRSSPETTEQRRLVLNWKKGM